MFDTQTKRVAIKCLGTSKMQFWHIIVKMTHIAIGVKMLTFLMIDIQKLHNVKLNSLEIRNYSKSVLIWWSHL